MHGLNHKTIEDSSKNCVIVKTGGQVRVYASFIGVDAVNHTLIEVGHPHSPDTTGEFQVGRIVHLRQMIEGVRFFGIQYPVPTAFMLEFQPPFFYIDIRCPVFSHGAEFYNMSFRVGVLDGEHQIEGTEHIIPLCVQALITVYHGKGG